MCEIYEGILKAKNKEVAFNMGELLSLNNARKVMSRELKKNKRATPQSPRHEVSIQIRIKETESLKRGIDKQFRGVYKRFIYLFPESKENLDNMIKEQNSQQIWHDGYFMMAVINNLNKPR